MSDPFDLDHLEDFNPAPPQVAGEPFYFQGLNPEQRLAAETVDGPVLVLAGAGTGKTKVLTARLAHILATRRAFPGQILSVTFTNKAAREMQHRVGDLIGGAVEGMRWLGTFHAIAAKMLRRHAELVGLRPDFTILDTDDQIRLLKQLLSAENLDDKRWPARLLASLIDRWKNRALTPEKLPAADSHAFADGLGQKLYREYQERLKTLNAADFGDLLLHVITILMQHPDILRDYQDRFKYILVDEYQDTNTAQYLWLRLLAQGRRNICCVGDDDQSIYGWRGAEVANILRFEQDFPGANIIRLERNYRSTGHILGAASGLIAANEGRLGKTLWTEDDAGEKVAVQGVWDGEEEARLVGDEIEALQRQGFSLNDMAILVRASFQTREFEDRLMKLGIGYKVIGGLRFYERQEIRDAMAYLRVVAQPDDSLAFERIFNLPKRGLGDAVLQTLHTYSRAKNISLFRAARDLVGTDEIRPAARRTLAELIKTFDRWRDQMATIPHTELAGIILEESGYTDMWRADKSADAPGRLDNLQELARAMGEFDTLPAFLEHVALVMDTERADGDAAISLMTMHAAKGLEFRAVFLPGWEEELFPSQRSLDEGGQASLEEERRLAYVGITRARERLFITHAANRRVYNQWRNSLPSRFIADLPADHIEDRSVSAPAFGGGFREQTDRWSAGDWAQASAGKPAIFDATPRSWSERFGGRVSPSAAPARPRPQQASHLKPGDRVFHEKFGYGIVASVDGNKLEIDFEVAGPKKVIDSFVRAA